MTLTTIAEGLAVELSLNFLTTKVCRGWDSNTNPTLVSFNGKVCDFELENIHGNAFFFETMLCI